MKLRGLFWILSFLLLLILMVTAYLVYMSGDVDSIPEGEIAIHRITGPGIFYILEALILFTVCFLVYFYRKVVKPLKTIGNGMELLREQDFSSRLSLVGQYEADRIVFIFNRMMEQLKNERLRLREQNHFLDLLVEASPLGVIILDFDHRVSTLNPSAVSFFKLANVENIIGKRLEESENPLVKELNKIPLHGVETIRLSDSSIYKCSHSSFVDQGFQHHFFLLETLTDEVMKAEKKAYEKVIRMIAHEVNNSTAGITSALDTVESALSEVEHMEDFCEIMQVCIDRCFSMSRFITNFADVVKIPEPQLSPVNLNELVRSCRRFMESVCLDRDITIIEDLDEHLPKVNIDSSLFEQVLVNIIKNSSESIGKEGKVYIKTTTSPVCLEIADTGNGISEDVESKLFTPFFSTKPNGQGIGLIFIREVLKAHHCTFSLRTYEDGLTRFKIIF